MHAGALADVQHEPTRRGVVTIEVGGRVMNLMNATQLEDPDVAEHIVRAARSSGSE